MSKHARKKSTAKPSAELLKLDFGCGPNKREGFKGVDILPFDGKVDFVMDVRKASWPWRDGSVDEAHSNHFLEHLEQDERVDFLNKLWKVMKPGAIATIVTPNWSHQSAYGDDTHKWPPLSAWYALYLDKRWRAGNAPHSRYTCDFTSTLVGVWDERLNGRNMQYIGERMQQETNAMRDLIVTLTKRDG